MEKIYSETEIHDVAAWLWHYMQQHKVVALHGPMGVGKTTLVHALCHQLGVQDAVSSPTFSIINAYEYVPETTAQTLYHIDLYRLKDEHEAIQAGVEDCLYSNTWCVVEWPERAPALFPDDTLHVRMELAPDGKRKIQIEGK